MFGGDSSHSAAQIAANGALKLAGSFAKHLLQVLEVIAGRDAKFADKVLGRSLNVAVLLRLLLIVTAKVGIGRNGRGALEALQACLGLGLC